MLLSARKMIQVITEKFQKASRLLLLVAAILLSHCVVVPSGAEASGNSYTKGEMKTIVALGDSLSAGFGVDINKSYPALLEKKLQGEGYNYRVVNAGVSGETSSGTLARLNWILNLKPQIVIVETGANDGLRGTDVVLLEDNLRSIIDTLQEQDVAVLLAGMKMVWNLGPDYVEQFNAVYPRVAKEKGVLLMPFFLEDVAAERSLNLEDGVHPNAKGYAIIAENIYPYVLEVIRAVEG